MAELEKKQLMWQEIKLTAQKRNQVEGTRGGPIAYVPTGTKKIE